MKRRRRNHSTTEHRNGQGKSGVAVKPAGRMASLPARQAKASGGRSRQGRLILSIIEESSDHPTADQVYARARKSIPNISLGTVYRNLERLRQKGLIDKISIGGSPSRFDRISARHFHVQCVSCGSICDVQVGTADKLISQASDASGFHVENLALAFFGTCPDCTRCHAVHGVPGHDHRGISTGFVREKRNERRTRDDIGGKTTRSRTSHRSSGASALYRLEDETTRTEGGRKMEKYVCTACGYIYDPEAGDPDNGVEPGTPFDKLPEDWVCPVCGVGTDGFEKAD